MTFSYNILENSFKDLKEKGIMGISVNIEGVICKIILKQLIESRSIVVDAYINDALIITNQSINCFDGVFRRKYANLYFQGDFYFLPTYSFYIDDNVDIYSVGTKFIFCYGTYKED